MSGISIQMIMPKIVQGRLVLNPLMIAGTNIIIIGVVINNPPMVLSKTEVLKTVELQTSVFINKKPVKT